MLTTLFSFSLALPRAPAAIEGLTPPSEIPPEKKSGRLKVTYQFTSNAAPKQYANGGGDDFTKTPLVPLKASGPFTLKAYNSESPIHLFDIVASNDKFFVGNMTRSLCPPGILDCPVGNVTALNVTEKGGAQLVSDILASESEDS